ncbi:hypothetical protein JCM3765_006181 [Sporobolomyces pararoseus]
MESGSGKMTEDQSATSSANGKKARRGRRQDDTLPPSRSRDVQRAFRARRAAHLTHLESTVEWLQAENNALREKAGIPLDGPPLTGPAPVEEIIEGPAELSPAPAPTRKTGGGKGSRKNSKVTVAEDHSDAESHKMDEDAPEDDERGAAEVLAAAGGSTGGGGTLKQNGISLPPMNVPSTSSSAPPPPETSQTLPSYSLPQQPSPRPQPPQNYHPHPSQIPYLVHGPHASVSYPSHPVPAYSPQQYGNPYAQYPQNGGGPPYNAYYPQPQQFPQNGQPHPNMQGAFSMTLPPSNQNSQPYASPISSSQRNSISSAVPSPQTSLPPSSHMRVSTIPTPAPLQHSHQPHVYPALVPNPTSNFPSKTPNPSFPLKPITNPIQQQQQHSVQDQQQPQPQQMMFNSIFPTPSPEDEQFFLDTFCGLANENMFLQSLYPNPEVYEIDPNTTTVESNEVVRTYQEGGGDNRVEQIKEEDPNRVSSARSSPLVVGGEKNKEFDAKSYKTFCVGLMKGVKGIEGLIAQKRKRDRDSEDSQEGKKRKRLSDGRSQEERKEKEDEAVAFLTAMASSGAREKDRECCEGIIDCGPPTEEEKEKKKDDDEDCCDGLIECGMTTNREKENQKKEECCEGLISCDSKPQPPTRPKLVHSDSLPPPPSTIHLPRSSTTSSSSCCGPKTSCKVPPTSSQSESDTYILVSLAFTELSPYMSQSQHPRKLPPTRIAELLFNDNPTISSPSPDSSAANLIIVPPTKEQEDKGKKGELYVRKEVVEAVKKWCENEMSK